MNKQEFLLSLRKGLSGLPQDDIEERLSFYSEIIDDKIEEGISEEQALAETGSVDEIVSRIIADISLTKLVKDKITPKRKLLAPEILLLILGSPIWLSLAVTVLAVIFSLYISLWSIVISLWSIFVCLAACSIGGVLVCVIFAVGGNTASGLAMLAAGALCAGLAIFAFFGCKAATKGTLILTKKMAIWIKNCFRVKEAAQ